MNKLLILVPYQTFSSVVRRAKKKKKKLGQSLWCLVIVKEDFRGSPLSLRGLRDTRRLSAFGSSSRDRSSHGQRAKIQVVEKTRKSKQRD